MNNPWYMMMALPKKKGRERPWSHTSRSLDSTMAGIEGTKCPRAKIMLRVLWNLEFPSAKFGLAQEWIGWPHVDASCGLPPLFGEWGATVSGSLGHDRRLRTD